MIRMNESTPDLLDPEASVVPGGAASLHDMARRLAPSLERVEPRPRVLASLRGRRSPAERQHRWPLADISGEAPPEAFQHRLRRALWAPEAGREERRYAIVPHRGDPEAVLGLGETGLLHKGRHSAGVARPYRGTAGQVDHGQMGVFLGDASPLGHALVDRELDLPEAWTAARERCQHAGIPADRPFATTPQLARPLRARAFAAGVPAQWVTGDSV